MVRRDPDATRQKLLEAANLEIYHRGFQNASIDQILRDTGLTKGALYHHFPTKADLGYAVVDEMVSNWILGRWVVPMEQANDPIDGLLQALNALTPDEIQMLREYGCPLNNLAQEMSAVDETFRHKIARVYQRWTERMADAFLRGQGAGQVASDLDCRQAAAFIAATLEGAAGALKNTRDPATLEACLSGLTRYLESLRASALATA